MENKNTEEEIKCVACDRTFKHAEDLAMHNYSKHPELVKKPRAPLPVRKIRNWVIVIVVLGLLIWGIYALIPKQNVKELNMNLNGKTIDIPSGAVHWHPKLTILIDGEGIPIQNNIGITVGKIIDTPLSGMRMSLLHTHENDGIIHLENNNPSSKPETLALGYFFYVWDKQFNSTCIFEIYCTDKGTLTMKVNGGESNEFENYIMRDKDQIIIEFKSGEEDAKEKISQ